MIILVTGGRYNNDVVKARAALEPYAVVGNILIHGAATGWDTTCESVWRSFQLPYIGVPARWGEFDKAAGPIRNQAMVSGHAIEPYARLVPDLVIAGEGGRGTQHCLDTAIKAGIPWSRA